MTKLPVIFRKFEGSIVAIFPTIPGSFNRHECLSYSHIGQHGSCSGHALWDSSQPASEAEALDLLNELQEIYEGSLTVYKRWQKKFDLERNKQFENYPA